MLDLKVQHFEDLSISFFIADLACVIIFKDISVHDMFMLALLLRNCNYALYNVFECDICVTAREGLLRYHACIYVLLNYMNFAL